MISTFIAILVVIFIILMMIKGFKIIPQAETMVIERLGKYHRTLNSGINIIWPIIDKPRTILWRVTNTKGLLTTTVPTKTIDLREQVYDFPKQSVITKDNVHIDIDALLYFKITDPMKAVYEVANFTQSIEMLTQTTLRNVLGELELDESLTSRDTINSKLRVILDEATDRWGVKVVRVELKDIDPPAEIKEQMEKQMRAERDKRAAILIAEGEKQSKILEAEGFRDSEISKAEGEKQSQILRASGEAEALLEKAAAEAKAIRTITEAFDNNEDAVKYLVATKYFDTLQTMTKEGKDSKVVYMPYEASNVLGSMGGIKDLFKN